MHADCIKKVQAAAGGRKLSEAKIQAIDDAISGKMRELARLDPEGWQAKSRDQRITEAATAAMQYIQTEAARKEMLAGMQAIKSAETATRIADMKRVSAQKVTQSQALDREIETSQNYVHAVHDDAISTLGDMLDAAGNKDGTGLLRNLGMRIFNLDNPAMTADVVREVFKGADGSTGNRVAQAGARAWLDTIERMRMRFNAAGGDVGRLDYGYLGQAVDSVRVRGVTADQFAEKIVPLLDRRRYLNEDGSMMTTQQIAAIVKASHETLASDGANKTEPGQFKGAGARANRGSESRVLHFKDGDAWMAYMGEFGEGSLYDSMMGHVGAMARNIGLVERYGPNPDQTFRVQADIAERADGRGTVANRSWGNTPQARWDILTGKTSSPENAIVAQVGQDVRNIQTAAKLGSAVVTSLTDVGTIAATLHYDRLPYFDMLKNLGRNLDKDHRAFLKAHGVIAESLTSTMNRWTGDHMTNGLTGKVANSVMKLSFMNAWTDGLRNAFSATMMQGFAKKVGKDWSKLDEWDRFLMGRKGITEEDWNIISKAEPTERNGAKYLTRDAIMGTNDSDVAQAIPGRLDAISQRIKNAVEELDSRNLKENEWIAGRVDRFKGVHDSANRAVKKFAASKDAQVQKVSAALQSRAKLLATEIELAQVRADIDAYLVTEKQQGKVRDFLLDVEDGADIERSVKKERTNPDYWSDSVVEVFSKKPGIGEQADQSVERSLRQRGSIGEKLGRREGNLKRRIVELESRIRKEESSANAAINAKAKDQSKRIDEARSELAEFVKKSIDRQKRRVAVMDRLTREEAPALAAEVLTRKQQAATKWMAFVSDEAQFAVINPDMATRAIATGGGLPAGTLRGEAMRSFMQFKSFPTAMITRHWGRLFDTPQGMEGAPAGFGAQTAGGAAINRMAVMAGLNVSLMMLGAIVLQEKAILGGKDPYDMTQGKFWVKAMGQGGGLGYVGDFLTKDPTEQRGSNFEQAGGVVLGPAGGAVAGFAGDLLLTNAWEAAKGKETHALGEAIRWGNSQLPYASLWQIRGAWDHWFIHNLQEAANPGYLGRMRSRAMKDWQQDYYWTPGEFVPDRAPDMGAAFGG